MALSYVRLIWRALDVVGDTADPDRLPDSVTLPEGTTVTITMDPAVIIDPEGRPATTYYPQSIPCTLDDGGNLVDPQGNVGVMIIDPTDVSIQPHNWTITLALRVPGAVSRTWAIKLTVPEPDDPDNPGVTTYDITRNGPVPAYAGTTTSAADYAAQASAYAQAAATAAESVSPGVAGGLATLDQNKKVPVAQIPDLSGTYASFATMQSEIAEQVGDQITDQVATQIPTAIAAALPLWVTNYGAKGDGVTDDWVALSDLISNAPAGSALIFPAGTYMISKPLPVKAGLAYIGLAPGHSYSAATIKMMANATDTRAVMADSNWLAGNATRQYDIVIVGLGLDGSSVATYGLVDQTRWGRFENLSIRDILSHGVYLPETTDGPTHEEQFVGIEVLRAGGNLFEAEENRFDADLIRLHGGPGLNGIHLVDANGWLVQSCHPFALKESGIVIDGSGTTKVIDNYWDGMGTGTSANTRYGVKINNVSGQTIVSRNQVLTKASTAPIVGYYARGASGVLFMTHNQINDMTTNEVTISDISGLNPASRVHDNALQAASSYLDHTEVTAYAGDLAADASGQVLIPHTLGKVPLGARAWMNDSYVGQRHFLSYRPSFSSAQNLSFVLRRYTDSGSEPNVTATGVYYTAWT